MPRFADLSISAFLDAVASSEPTPGGGTASAVAGAMGVSLLMMVAGLSKTRGNTDAERTRLAEARTALASVRDRLVVLADDDTEAFNKVLAAYRLPKGTDDEKRARKAAIGQAMHGAAAAPRDVVRAICEAARSARVVAQHGNPSAASDVRVALELLDAAAAGAAANVEINLGGIGDEDAQKRMASEMLDLNNHLSEELASARAALKDATPGS